MSIYITIDLSSMTIGDAVELAQMVLGTLEDIADPYPGDTLPEIDDAIYTFDVIQGP